MKLIGRKQGIGRPRKSAAASAPAGVGDADVIAIKQEEHDEEHEDHSDAASSIAQSSVRSSSISFCGRLPRGIMVAYYLELT
jgi:hypothetical protein